ncbi:hypothetical protein KZZ52_53905 [Dactylosporangium sp. AC04546]|uniref:hypothetical protein n=1 Tax=Dactylosporangium sp. AC04546 TaxID=2862460 RepID=UPI001EDCDE28|nr:hypothetical protein [Dactylosporangium sp. AC04546]WVK82751.1 hypothetical protein KZZ52_53905 [Dactylosporangium sp. AC04546]
MVRRLPRWAAAFGSWPNVAPVAGLLVLAPLVGEYLLGNVSVRLLPALPFLVPLYGGGALLVREIVRRTGRGWPALLLLAAAYGVAEAGLVDQSLFNPTFEGHDFQATTPVPALGISAGKAFAFVVGHAVWSIGVPVALVEWLTPGRRHTPWLRTPGLIATILLYLLGCWIIFDDLRQREGFLASPGQRAGAAAVALLLVAAGLLARRPRAATAAGRVPPPWVVAVLGFAASSAFVLSSETWAGLAAGVVLVVTAAVVVGAAARRAGWTERHRMALAAGALLTYGWLGFVLTGLVEPGDPVRWAGNAGFLAGAVALVAWCSVRPRAPRPPSAASPTAAPPPPRA